jgi:hypothetical protein
MQFQTDETCPRCRKRVPVATIDLHPTNSDVAVRSSNCTACGHVSSYSMSIRPAQVAVGMKGRQLRIK